MLKIEYLKINDLKPYEKNARKHQQADVETIKNSIIEFGMCDPIGIWGKDNTIVEGHGRLIALKQLGYKEVPVIRLDHLTDEQRRAYGLAHNKTAEMSDWDFDLLGEELDDIFDIDMSEFGFDITDDFQEKMKNAENMEEDEEYNEFVDKSKPKKTTDDCYTPPKVYEAVREWAVEKYGLQGRPIVRPFYPGGDYQNEKYPKNCVVIDNPPFSISSQIYDFYIENGIDFFLFAPSLTLFSGNRETMNYIVCGTPIIYENGAKVPTSFATNLGDKKIIVSGELNDRLEVANEREKVELPKYVYPDTVVSAASLQRISKKGVTLEIDDGYFVRKLDAQGDEAIFGGGFLISETAAAEKAAAVECIKWELSEREKEIVKSLGE